MTDKKSNYALDAEYRKVCEERDAAGSAENTAYRHLQTLQGELALLTEERDEVKERLGRALADLKETREKLATAQGILANAAVERQGISVLLGAIEEALREYPQVPRETFIGREDLAAKVTWLARRAAMLERSDVSRWQALEEALRRAIDFCHEVLDEHQPAGELFTRTQAHLAYLAGELRRAHSCPVRATMLEDDGG